MAVVSGMADVTALGLSVIQVTPGDPYWSHGSEFLLLETYCKAEGEGGLSMTPRFPAWLNNNFTLGPGSQEKEQV